MQCRDPAFIKMQVSLRNQAQLGLVLLILAGIRLQCISLACLHPQGCLADATWTIAFLLSV